MLSFFILCLKNSLHWNIVLHYFFIFFIFKNIFHLSFSQIIVHIFVFRFSLRISLSAAHPATFPGSEMIAQRPALIRTSLNTAENAYFNILLHSPFFLCKSFNLILFFSALNTLFLAVNFELCSIFVFFSSCWKLFASAARLHFRFLLYIELQEKNKKNVMKMGTN